MATEQLFQIDKENLPILDEIFSSLTKMDQTVLREKFGTKVEELKQQVKDNFQPIGILKRCKIENITEDEITLNNGTVFSGKFPDYYIRTCSELAVYQITIGEPQQAEFTDSVFDEYIVDAWKSAFIESAFFQFYQLCRAQITAEGNFTLPEFSPGYEGFPLENQRQLFDIFTENNLGLTLSPQFLMLPLKSLSGLIGITKQKPTDEYNPCEICGMQNDCTYSGKCSYRTALYSS
ncbi:MAG TPA: hypothetical protein DCO79_14105 [Spirochaeta sp.]|nr:hypothetical protein [Spirochaeta sp.]